jgi:peptidoglycan hydrolase FlgJ
MIRPTAPMPAIGSVATPGTPPKSARDPELRKAAESFEAVMLRQLIGTMRKAKLADDFLGSSATDSFREMADARVADSMASLGQFGIADLVEKQLQGRTGAGQ